MLKYKLNEIKARKAKFGFKGGVYTHNFLDLAEILKQVQSIDHDVVFELNFNMNANEFKLYTDNEKTAQFIREQFSNQGKS